MSANEFAALCAEYTIAPEIALETEAVVYALQWAKKSPPEVGREIVRAALEGNY